jgi:hypothetical protein
MTQRTRQRKPGEHRSEPKGRGARNEPRQGLRDPGKIDFDEANRVLKRLVRENAAWFKEMAAR